MLGRNNENGFYSARGWKDKVKCRCSGVVTQVFLDHEGHRSSPKASREQAPLWFFFFFRAKAEVLDFDHVLRVYGIISEKFLSFMSKGFRL